jgi:hypothetical protein
MALTPAERMVRYRAKKAKEKQARKAIALVPSSVLPPTTPPTTTRKVPPPIKVIANPLVTGSRAPDGTFLPGRSGNPSGRPRATEEYKRIRQLFRENCEEAVYEARRLMIESEDDRVRLAACQLIQERGWGKAPADYDSKDDAEGSLQLDVTVLTPEERANLYQYLMKMKAGWPAPDPEPEPGPEPPPVSQ